MDPSPGAATDQPSLAALLADYGLTVLGTVGTILAALAAYGTWAMDWPLAFLGAAIGGLVAYTLQAQGAAGRRAPLDRRLLRSTARIGPYAGLIGIALSVPTGRPGWAAGFLVAAVGTYVLRRLVDSPAGPPDRGRQ
jgi:hypothetical protein